MRPSFWGCRGSGAFLCNERCVRRLPPAAETHAVPAWQLRQSKGRPRASKNLSAVFETALNERVPVNDNGKRKKITMFEAITKQAVGKAAGGDHRALRLVFDMWFRLHPDGKQEPSALELMRSLADEAAQYIKTEAQAALDKQIENNSYESNFCASFLPFSAESDPEAPRPETTPASALPTQAAGPCAGSASRR
jgi:hypothetical protein